MPFLSYFGSACCPSWPVRRLDDGRQTRRICPSGSPAEDMDLFLMCSKCREMRHTLFAECNEIALPCVSMWWVPAGHVLLLASGVHVGGHVPCMCVLACCAMICIVSGECCGQLNQ